jgi:hypothetical protein
MTAAILILTAIVGFLGARARRRPVYGVVGGLALGAVALAWVVPFRGWFDLSLGPGEWVVAIGAIVLAAEVAGTPEAFAARTGIGRHSKPWLFDTALYRLYAPLNRTLEAAPDPRDLATHARWRQRALVQGRSTIAKARRMRAPDAEWAEVARRYIDVYARILESLERGGDQATGELVTRLNAEVDELREALRRRYRAAPGARRSA